MKQKMKRFWSDYKWVIIPLLIIIGFSIWKSEIHEFFRYFIRHGLLISFIIWFLFAGKKISRVDINVKKLPDYVGETSNFHTLCHGNANSGCNDNREEHGEKKIKNGLEKNLRIFYSRWFWVFVILTVMSVIMSVQNYYYPDGDYSLLMSADSTVKVKESTDYKIEKGSLVTSKNTLKFPVIMKMQSSDRYPWITVSYTIDTIIVTFDSVVKFDSVVEHSIESEKYHIPIRCKIKRSITPNSKDIKYTIDSIERCKADTIDIKYIRDSIERYTFIVKEDSTEYINSLELWHPDDVDNIKREQFFHQIEVLSKKMKDTIKHSVITNLFITDFINDAIKEVKKDTSTVTPNTSINTTNYELKALVSIIGLSEKAQKDLTKKYDKKIKKLEEKDKNSLRTKLNTELDILIARLDGMQKETAKTRVKKLEEVLKDYEIKPQTIKDFYSTSIDILSLLVNVLLLLVFGFLNTKTDLFAKEKNSDDYVVYKNFVIGTFIVIGLILLVDFFVSEIGFSDSLMFVMHLLIAITSIIAVFGCWGSMNNSYTKLPWWFIFTIIFYAMTNFFELYSPYASTSNFHEYITPFVSFVAFIGQWLIIWILLYWAPNNKRILWYFFTATNNFRTENDYDDFKNIFSMEPNLFKEKWQKRNQIAKTLIARRKIRNLK